MKIKYTPEIISVVDVPIPCHLILHRFKTLQNISWIISDTPLKHSQGMILLLEWI